jgi:hypothetical protein
MMVIVTVMWKMLMTSIGLIKNNRDKNEHNAGTQKGVEGGRGKGLLVPTTNF